MQELYDTVNFLVKRLSPLTYEELHLIWVDKNYYILDIMVASCGIVDCCYVDIKEVCKEGKRLESSGCMMIHNHPNGDSTPSYYDLVTTKELLRNLQSIDIELKDHLIVGRTVFSFREHRLI
jgi:DNA repair protein RadC